MAFSDHSVTGYAGVNDFAFLLLKRLDCVEIFVCVSKTLPPNSNKDNICVDL